MRRRRGVEWEILGVETDIRDSKFLQAKDQEICGIVGAVSYDEDQSVSSVSCLAEVFVKVASIGPSNPNIAAVARIGFTSADWSKRCSNKLEGSMELSANDNRNGNARHLVFRMPSQTG